MMNGLRAKRIKEKEIKDGVFFLEKNTPKIIDKRNNDHYVLLYENKPSEMVDEKVYILSVFNDDAWALVGNEFRLNLYDEANTPDISYYYFGVNYRVVSYLIDLKKKLAGRDHIIHLVEQWKMGIATAKGCILMINAKEGNYALSKEDTNLVVITEKNDKEKRRIVLEGLVRDQEVSSKVAGFIGSKRRADKSSDIKTIQILRKFEEGCIEVEGIDYPFVIREFVESKHELKFLDGILIDHEISGYSEITKI